MDREFLYVARGMTPGGCAARQAAESAGRQSGARIPSLLPGRRSDRPRAGLHQHRRRRARKAPSSTFDNWLAGEDGAKRVIQDSKGRKVEDVESIRPVRPGRDLTLSLDLRIQYMAYRELKSAIVENRARAGSVVVIDIDTGEVLAMVNQPAYNPNDRSTDACRRRTAIAR